MKKSYRTILTLFFSIVAVMAILVYDNEKREITRAASVIEDAGVIYAKDAKENNDLASGNEEVALTEEQLMSMAAAETEKNVKKYKTTTNKDKFFYKELEKMYHKDKNTKKYLNFDLSPLKEKITKEYYLDDNMVLCGDSYCGLLSRHMRKRKGFKGEVFAEAGRSVVENKQKYIDAINSDKDIVILATSVNDVLVQTDLKEFKDTIEELFKLAYAKGKLFIIHTNCDFMGKDTISANNSMKYEIAPKYYDWAIITSASKFGNVIYIDCNDIANPELLMDGIHYSEEFYNIMIDRIYNELQQRFGF